MRRMRKVSIALSVSALVGCATVLPTRSGPEQGGIGISVRVRPPIGLAIFTQASQRVYFVRVDGEQGLFAQDHFILSNHSAGGWVYFLNARPGRYAAVASSLSTQGRNYVTVFSKELIESTEVTVAPGTMAFMGEYLVDASVSFKDADAAQRHYLNVIAPGARTGFWAALATGGTFYIGSLLEAKRDLEAELRFLNTAADHLRDTGWSSLLDRSREASVSGAGEWSRKEPAEPQIHLFEDQFIIVLSRGWFVHDQNASIGRPGPYGVVVFSPVDLGRFSTAGSQAAPDEMVKTFISIDRGEIPSFFVDRHPAEKGMTCDGGFTEKARKKLLEVYQASARGGRGGKVVGTPEVEAVPVGGCQGLRVRMQASVPEGDKWDFLIYAVSDGQTTYDFTLRNQREFFEKNIPAFEKAISTLKLVGRRGQ